MKRRFVIFLFTAVLCGQVFGNERSEEELMGIAAQVLNQPASARRVGGNVAAGQLRVLRRLPMLSMVGTPEIGFAIVSHDDRVRPVLGYSIADNTSEHCDPSPEDFPCGLQWFLETLNASLQAMADDGYEWTPVGIRPDGDVKPQVEPMLETDWYQHTPFNDWCPTFVNDKGQTQHHVVGCGATATTQVMYYHRHPLVGQGSTIYSYDPKQVIHVTEPVAENMLELSCNFDTVRFDWNSMAAHYGNKRSSDEAANVAVARLCKAVGIAMHMIYTETSGSGSSFGDMVRALRSHFGYGRDARSVSRNSFADSTWMHIAFEEISNGRPILYGGNSNQDQSGHFFVLDGYDADGLFHINWGWGRNSYYDGYFDLNYLSPNNTNSHYSVNQGMVMMVHPEGTPIEMTEINVDAPGSLSALLPTNRSLRLRIKGILNASDVRALRQLGCGVKDADGRITAELTHLDLSQVSLVDHVLPDSAFFGCARLMQLELPSSVTAIGSYAFANCFLLTHLTLPRSLTTLGTAPFTSCVQLTDFSVEEGNRHFATIDGILTNAKRNKLVAYPEARSEAVIPSTIDSIGPNAFRYCFNLSEVRIPSHVRVICESAFQNCTNLQQVTLEEGVERILALAFNNCDSLRTLHLPTTIDSIGQRLFIYSDNMQTVTMADGNPNYRVENNCLLSRDGKQLFQALLTEVENVDIPASVEMTEKFAFYGTKMKHLTIPSTLKKIGNQSIYFCQSLTQLDIEEGIEEIDHYAFNGCSALSEVHLPASLTTIGYAIFDNCTGLHHVDISEASTLFRTDDNMLFSKDGTVLQQQLTDDKEEYTVPDTVTAIAPSCFRYLNNLHRLTIPASVKSIGNYVLFGCQNLTDVVCRAGNPLAINQYVFAQTDLSQTTLHVPKGSLQAYQTAIGWEQFGTIVDDQPDTDGNAIRVVVPPLLSSKWGAGTPYNDLCPEYETGKRGAVGCGAVSTAQVMRYWQWPDHGVGQNTYTSILNYDPEHTIELSVDFGSATYQWNQMLDDYSSQTGTDEQRQAVATLCYHIGVAMNMHFGAPSPNDKSPVEALNRHFRYYAKQMKGKSDDEYAEVMRRELDAGRPVLFHGENEKSTSTHTFVCDGYAEDGYFHFNFGFSGNGNGYYRLSELLLPDGRDYRFHQYIRAYDIRPYRGEIPAGTVELTVETPGSLQQLIDSTAAPFATSLKVSGPLNGADLLALRRLAGRDEYNIKTGHIMTDLDLSDASFVPSDDVYYQRETDGVLTTYTITSADEVPENAFRNTNLRRIVLPNSARTIRKQALYACLDLEELDFGVGITLIDTSAVFYTGLHEVNIPQQVTDIRPWAFGDNKHLKRLHIADGVATIGYCAFNRCDSIEEVTCDIPQPFYIPNNVFSTTDFAQAVLRVPAGTAPLYRRTQWWRLFAHIEEMEGEPQPLPYMVMASWNQKEPFNGDCPEADGLTCVAGCAPIAMAQILSYYRQPAQGHGHAAYHYDYNGVSKDIDADFDSHPFDWDNIRDVYSESSSEPERNAVANLVYMTGVAMKQMYSPTATSTVNPGTWMWGLQHYMHLSPTSRWLHRKYYSTAEWTDMINAQLEAGHPVFYNAAHTAPYNAKSGHFFVIDGRDSQGRYHFNFGHDSSQQDKFGSLDAGNQGSEPKPGNVFVCYHNDQKMITDCYPVDGTDTTTLQRCEALLERPFVLENDPQLRKCSVTGRVRAAFMYRCICFNADSIWYTLGFYRNGQLAAVSPSWRMNRISIGGGVSNVDRYFMLPTELADGDYEMALVTRDAETSPWLRGWDDAPNSVPVSVSGQVFTFRLPDCHNGPTHLYLKDDVQEIVGAQEGGRTFEFTISNPSTNNFVDTLRVDIQTAGQVATSFMPTSVYDGQSLTYHLFFSNDKANFSDDFSVSLSYHDTPSGQWLPLSSSKVIPGDANGDGTVDVADIATIISIMAGNASGSFADIADVNNDGSVDVADIATIISLMAGFPSSPLQIPTDR